MGINDYYTRRKPVGLRTAKHDGDSVGPQVPPGTPQNCDQAEPPCPEGDVDKEIYDRHLQANVGQCRNGDDEYKGLTLQSLSPSHKVW